MILESLLLAAAVATTAPMAPMAEVEASLPVDSSVETYVDDYIDESVSFETDAPLSSSGSSGVVYVPEDNSDEVALLSDAVELLAENSSTVTGTMNSSVLDLMDRIINGYPGTYSYAGFRVDSDDAYRATLYIASDSIVNGNTVTFSDDCVSINFYRFQQTGYSSYVYYVVDSSPGASVDVSSRTIVYTNALEGYPELGSISRFPVSYIWVIVIAIFGSVLLTRRIRRD